MASVEPGIFINKAVKPLPSLSTSDTSEEVESFHRKLPDSNQTPLVSLPRIAEAIGVNHVLVKDESLRFGLPSFKILGASWAIYRAVIARVGSQIPVSLDELGTAARSQGVHLVTCTDGNWGRSCARMAKYLGIPIKIFVPKTMDAGTQDRIRSEGAEVVPLSVDYDACVKAAEQESKQSGALLVLDTAWEGFEEVPGWVIEGYSTMLNEADRQVENLLGKPVHIAIASAGVGSFAQAVTSHYKGQPNRDTRVVAVEPTTAACVRTSLEAGARRSIETGETVMDGMNCGTVSSIAWPILKDGLDACVSVSDLEAHQALRLLHDNGVKAGPCGAAPLAAALRLQTGCPSWFTNDSVVILFCTEGYRPYRIPT